MEAAAADEVCDDDAEENEPADEREEAPNPPPPLLPCQLPRERGAGGGAIERGAYAKVREGIRPIVSPVEPRRSLCASAIIFGLTKRCPTVSKAIFVLPPVMLRAT
jgi:hypothetical protein